MHKDSYYIEARILDRDFPISIEKNVSQAENSIVFTPHWHEQTELLFFVGGSGTIWCDDHKIDVMENDLIVINSSQMHSLISSTSCLTYFCIDIDFSLLRAFSLDSCDYKYLSPMSNQYIFFENLIRNDQEIIDCVVEMIEEYQKKQIGYELKIKSLVFNFFVLLLRHHAHKLLGEAEYRIKTLHAKRLATVLQYLEEHYFEPCSLELLASQVNLSPSRFCHIFKDLIGLSPIAYVCSVRIKHAKELLHHSDFSVTEIAWKTGFEDINYFSRQFKKYVGLTPSQYRANGM